LLVGLHSCTTPRQSYTNDKEAFEVYPSDRPRGQKETYWLLGVSTVQSSQVKSRWRLCIKFFKNKQKQKHPTHNGFPRSSARRKRACLSMSTVQSSVCPCLDAHCNSQICKFAFFGVCDLRSPSSIGLSGLDTALSRLNHPLTECPLDHLTFMLALWSGLTAK